ncbi:MAG: HNH endonuclease signature motif containing protein [Candidatus Bathyarchaeia archaeon]
MVKEFKPESILRRLQKAGRQQVFHRDQGACVACGSREKLEAAHVIPPPMEYFLRHFHGSSEELERAAAPFYREENLVLLCRKCHWMVSWRSHYKEFAASLGPEKAMELTVKALTLFGVPLEDLKRGKDKQLMERIMEHMFSIYGPGWRTFHRELMESRVEKGAEEV